MTTRIAQVHQYIANVLEVCASLILGRIDPFHHLWITPAGYACLHTRCILRCSCGLIIEELHIVYPAIDHWYDQLLQIQP